MTPTSVLAQVIINEFSPKGSPEWVEFLNNNGFEVNLDGYYFDDDSDFNSDAGNSVKIKLEGLFPTNSLCFLEMSSFLNDSGDTPTLFAPNGDIQDTYSYASTSAGLSYSRIPDGGEWQVNTTFSKTAISCSSLQTPTPSPTLTPTQTPTASSTNSPTPSPTLIPTPTSTKTVTPKPTPTPRIKPKVLETVEPLNYSTISPTGVVAGTSVEKKFPTIALLFIISGVAFLGYGGFLLYNTKNDVQDKSNQTS